MLRRLSLFLLCLSCAVTAAPAQEGNGDVFLSLTRKAEALRDLPTNVSVITSEQIQSKAARDLGEVLENETGLVRGKNGTFGQLSSVAIRGSQSEQTLVLVDGRRANSISLGGADLSTFPADRIEKIEIIRGAASAVYGADAFGGVINVITKRPKENAPLLSFGASAGSFGAQDYAVNFSVKRERTWGAVTAARNSVDGWRTNSGADSRDLFARLGYDAGGLGLFDLSGSSFRSELGTPGQAFLPSSYLPLTPDRYDGALERSTRSPEDRQKDARDYLKLEHTLNGEANSLITSVYASRDYQTFNKPSMFLNADYDSAAWGGNVQLNTVYGITLGGEWREEKHLQKDRGTGAEKMNRSRVASALYAQEEFRWGGLSAIPNLRLDDNSLFGSEVTPKLTLVYRASDELKLSANAGKAWRAPTFNELFWPLETYVDAGVTYVTKGNAAVKPEESLRYDLGVELQREKYRGSLTFFLNDNTDLIDWNGTFDTASMTSTYMPENIDKSVQQGFELEAGHTIASGLSHKLNYTYVWAENTRTRRVLKYTPRNVLNYTVSFLTPWNMRLKASAQYVSAQLDTMYNQWVPEYTVVGCSLSQRISDVELWARADNLTDARYQSRLGYPLPGLTVQAGATLRFWE